MTAVVSARTAEDVRDAVAEAVAAGEPLEIVGRGSKRSLGRAMSLPRTLDVSGLSGVIDYAPDELVLVARPGTPLSEIEALLAANRQTFAFEPPTFARLLGANAGASLGGVVASNLAGPRRFQAGAVRDHFLGFHAVSGRGVPFVAGSRVMKNVTGYDLSKLMAGSWGTLAVLTQVNLRTAPLPEAEETLLVRGLDERAAVERLTAALKSPAAVSGRGVPFVAGSRVMKNVTGYDLSKLMAGSWGTLAVLTQVNLRTAPLPEAEETLLVRGLDERAAVARMTAALKSAAAVSGAAHLPADVAGALAAVASGGASLTALRVEGTPASVKARREMLEAAGGDLAVAAGETSRALWREIANAEPLAEPAGAAVWRFTVEPGLAAMIAQGLRERHGARVLMDWAGGLLTVALPQLALTEAAALAAPVWEAIPKGRGQAMLLRGSAALRETPFPPMEPGLAALNARVKRSFDPSGVLNPGRMYEGF